MVDFHLIYALVSSLPEAKRNEVEMALLAAAGILALRSPATYPERHDQDRFSALIDRPPKVWSGTHRTPIGEPSPTATACCAQEEQGEASVAAAGSAALDPL